MGSCFGNKVLKFVFFHLNFLNFYSISCFRKSDDFVTFMFVSCSELSSEQNEELSSGFEFYPVFDDIDLFVGVFIPIMIVWRLLIILIFYDIDLFNDFDDIDLVFG